MAEYKFTKELKSQTKVGWIIYIFDFFFLLIYMSVSHILSSMVNEKLHLLYYIFSFIVALLLVLPSPYNHKRRMYQSILLYLKQDHSKYRPLRKGGFKEDGNTDI